MENNIYVLGLDMDGKTVETIAREAAEKISDLAEQLLQKQQERDTNRKDEQRL